jgi:hypothetical protein
MANNIIVKYGQVKNHGSGLKNFFFFLSHDGGMAGERKLIFLWTPLRSPGLPLKSLQEVKESPISHAKIPKNWL